MITGPLFTLLPIDQSRVSLEIKHILIVTSFWERLDIYVTSFLHLIYLLELTGLLDVAHS